MTNLKGIELDVGISMGQPLDKALDGLVGAVGIAGYFVAHFEYGAPVLGCEVLVGRLSYNSNRDHGRWSAISRIHVVWSG